MSNTTFVTVPSKSWVEVLAAAKTGLISNEGGNTIRIVEAASLPAASQSKGHTLNVGEKITRTTPAGQEIYAYGVNGASEVSLTAS